MGIIAVLAGLGIAGMSVFRRTVQIEQAKNDLLSGFREAQNLSRNSVSSSVKSSDILKGQVAGYAIFFDASQSNNYSLRYCVQTSFLGQTRYDCTGVERATAKQFINSEVQISPSNPNKCRGIFFARISGDISAMSSDISQLDDTGTCDINLSHSQGSETRQIHVNLMENNISV